MERIDISEETALRVQHLIALYKAGRVFTKDKDVHRTCELYLAANDFATACGRDIAKANGEKVDGPPTYEILYNMKAIIRVRLGNGYCGVGIYDFDEGTCYYAGIVRC